jgi:uncharacterized protein
LRGGARAKGGRYEVAPCPGRGKGVFTKVPVGKGTLMVRYGGRARWIWDIPKEKWDHCLQVDYDRYLVPRRGSAGWYLNHSCDPNCYVVGKGEVVAARDIEEGEELTFDYSTNVGWEPYAMECRCGAPRCRGVVRSYANLPPALRRRYGKNVSEFLLRKRPSSGRRL